MENTKTQQATLDTWHRTKTKNTTQRHSRQHQTHDTEQRQKNTTQKNKNIIKTDSTKNRPWTWVLSKGKQFLFQALSHNVVSGMSVNLLWRACVIYPNTHTNLQGRISKGIHFKEIECFIFLVNWTNE
jgi:sensor c-di-GMP phosphodiesterase-like protein